MSERLALLEAPEAMREAIAERRLSPAVARVILRHTPLEYARVLLMEIAIEQGWSKRAAEQHMTVTSLRVALVLMTPIGSELAADFRDAGMNADEMVAELLRRTGDLITNGHADADPERVVRAAARNIRAMDWVLDENLDYSERQRRVYYAVLLAHEAVADLDFDFDIAFTYAEHLVELEAAMA